MAVAVGDADARMGEFRPSGEGRCGAAGKGVPLFRAFAGEVPVAGLRKEERGGFAAKGEARCAKGALAAAAVVLVVAKG